LNKPKPIVQKVDFGEYEQEVKRIWDGLPPTSLLERWQKTGYKPKFYNAGTIKARYCRIQKLVGIQQ
jgi:hypothetical protein